MDESKSEVKAGEPEHTHRRFRVAARVVARRLEAITHLGRVRGESFYAFGRMASFAH
jgi:hypothetical protein